MNLRNSSMIVLGVLSVAVMIASPAANSQSKPAAGDVLTPPDHPLDPRIKPDKVTENDPPPLPTRVAAPLPPVHQISDKADQVPIDAELWQKAHDAIERGLKFLESRQSSNGGWDSKAQAAPTNQPDQLSPVSLAITSLVVKSFAQSGPDAAQSAPVRRALHAVRNAHRADRKFDDSNMANYITSAVLSALATVDNSADRDLMNDAIDWLKVNQWDQGEGLNARQDWFGGAGYGNGGRPDLSNTQMMLDALYEAGLSPDEPTFQKALLFASRTQNLKATNKAPWAGDDGGFIYSPANGGESMGSEAAGEGRFGEKLVAAGQPRSLRSYGSMTYAGFKSMLYAGLSPDDVRVRAAYDWLRHHWTFDENPGVGQQGLYYYYHTLSRALFIAQQNQITDAADNKHNWREELINALLKRQRDDGSWVNSADRWMESDRVLVTAYAVLALEESLKPVHQK